MHDFQRKSRRELLSIGASAGLSTLFGSSRYAYATERSGVSDPNRQDIRGFGVAGDARTDDTAAFQRALDLVFKSGGGTLYAPPGRYLLRGSLTVPDGVTL